MKTNIYGLNYDQIENIMKVWDEPDFRSLQIWQGLYNQLWSSPDEFSNIPLPLREKLNHHYEFNCLTGEETRSSNDGLTKKTLYRLPDGSAIETVLMIYNDRNTVCISSQVGCAIGCGFCATGNMGFIRNLDQGEIVEQVVKTAVKLQENGKRLTNVVFMGMGEPFHNYQNVISAIKILNDAKGLNMGARRFTVSTVGIIPGINEFIKEELQVNLAISLHAADDALRSSLVPINQKYPILDLLKACSDYIEATNRRVTIEWALISGVNDSKQQAKKLVHLIEGKLFHVNLIQLNPVDHYPGIPSANQTALEFQSVLSEANISCTIRLRRGIDIAAGCGQLASSKKEKI